MQDAYAGIFYTYKLTDLEKDFGPIPEAFTKCFSCKEPAIYVLCGSFEEPEKIDGLGTEQEIKYSDPEEAKFAEFMREGSGQPIALPVCVFHENGSVPH